MLQKTCIYPDELVRKRSDLVKSSASLDGQELILGVEDDIDQNQNMDIEVGVNNNEGSNILDNASDASVVKFRRFYKELEGMLLREMTNDSGIKNALIKQWNFRCSNCFVYLAIC